MANDDEIRSDEQEGDDIITAQLEPVDAEISADEEKGDDQIPPQCIPENDIITSEGQEEIERIPRNSKMPYSENCLLEETVDILLFNKRSYDISVSVSSMTNRMLPANSVFDTGAGPNPIRGAFLKTEWLRAKQTNNRIA